jgi:hypothetical protein
LEDQQDVGCSRLFDEVVTPALAQPENAFFEQLSRISIEDLRAMAVRDAA